MTVLVTAASEHGATAEIAARIGADLADSGLDVEVKKPEEVHELAQYEAVVVGSAIYMGQWLKGATSFVDAHADQLAERPTWLFSSGPIVGDPPIPDTHDAARGDTLAETVHAREHKLFAGKLDKSKLNWCEKIAVRCAHAREGDYRDWHAIDEWAAAIAGELQQTRVSAPSLRS
jgi:menaquinone-dependent protoporphyrinogen oxidase